MKTKYLKLPFILAIYLCFSCSKDEFIDEEFIDITSTFDSVFAKELQARGYIPDANRIYAKDVADITELDVSGTDDAVGELTSLKGIEYFTSLKHLNCSGNKLTELNISNNTDLEFLYCSSNELTSLDVSNNPALMDLNCSDNQLTSLDVSNNPALMDLNCSDNQLTSLDVSNNFILESLICSGNKLTSMDISNNTDLLIFRCHDNPGYTPDGYNPEDHGAIFNVAHNDSLTMTLSHSYTTKDWIYDGHNVSIYYYVIY